MESHEQLHRKEVEKGSHSRVLVMDDNYVVREVAVELITCLGYEVESACDGESAISLYKKALKDGHPFRAVILDLVVSNGMGGEEALNEMRKVDPDVRAIVCSGYSDSLAARDYKAFGFWAAMPKPYRLEELNRTLHGVMGVTEIA